MKDEGGAAGNEKFEFLFTIKELIDASSDPITVIDTHPWRVIFQNRTGEESLGEIVGRHCYEAIGHCSAPCSFCKAPEALKSGKTISAEVCRSDGTAFLIQWAPIRRGNTLLAIETI